MRRRHSGRPDGVRENAAADQVRPKRTGTAIHPITNSAIRCASTCSTKAQTPAPATASTMPNTPPIVSPRIERMANCLNFSDRRSTAIGAADSVDNTGIGASAHMTFLISASCSAAAIAGANANIARPNTSAIRPLVRLAAVVCK